MEVELVVLFSLTFFLVLPLILGYHVVLLVTAALINIKAFKRVPDFS